MPAPVMVVVVATAAVITVTMVAVVMAAAEYQTRHYGYNEHFEKVLIHDWNDRGLCLFI